MKVREVRKTYLIKENEILREGWWEVITHDNKIERYDHALDVLKAVFKNHLNLYKIFIKNYDKEIENLLIKYYDGNGSEFEWRISGFRNFCVDFLNLDWPGGDVFLSEKILQLINQKYKIKIEKKIDILQEIDIPH